MPYYEKHIFVCTNQKESGKKCCGQAGGENAWKWLKSAIEKQGLHGAGKIRVSRSGCLGRCAEGPWIVSYPQGNWLHYEKESDLPKILEDICN